MFPFFTRNNFSKDHVSRKFIKTCHNSRFLKKITIFDLILVRGVVGRRFFQKKSFLIYRTSIGLYHGVLKSIDHICSGKYMVILVIFPIFDFFLKSTKINFFNEWNKNFLNKKVSSVY